MQKLKYLIFLIFINYSLSGQNYELDNTTFFDNVRFGGGVNINLGNNYSSFAISPSAIYDFSKEFSAGVSFTYIYVKNKSTIVDSSNLFGGSILTLFRPANFLQFSAEYETLKLKQRFNTTNSNSDWQPAFYLGLEYVTGNLSMGLRYDVLYDKSENLIYSSALSPIFRVYF